MNGVEGNGRTPLRTCSTGCQRWASRQLAEFSGELTCFVSADRSLSAKTVASRYFHPTINHEPSRRVQITNPKNDVTGGKYPSLTSAKAPYNFNLLSNQRWKYLICALNQNTHSHSFGYRHHKERSKGALPIDRMTFQAPSRGSEVPGRPSTVGRGIDGRPSRAAAVKPGIASLQRLINSSRTRANRH
ncbi:hypothetical protein ABIB95_007733 [Bradyrhizobium sp. LA2.1]